MGILFMYALATFVVRPYVRVTYHAVNLVITRLHEIQEGILREIQEKRRVRVSSASKMPASTLGADLRKNSKSEDNISLDRTEDARASGRQARGESTANYSLTGEAYVLEILRGEAISDSDIIFKKIGLV
jgi:hypothetical protein